MQTDERPTKETLEQWHKDPNNWIWGWIYYNKADKRIFPPKRFRALGWTVNFANPVSVLTLIIVILVVALISSYFESH